MLKKVQGWYPAGMPRTNFARELVTHVMRDTKDGLSEDNASSYPDEGGKGGRTTPLTRPVAK